MLKPLLALLAAPILSSATSPETFTLTYHPAIVQVICDEGKGSAFRVGEHGLVSVVHVTSLHNCTIDGEPVKLRLSDVYRDVSFGRIDADGVGLRVNCGGFKDGETLYAIGYAGGLPRQRLVTVQVSERARQIAPWGSFTVFVGAERFIPGMSGGAVLNRAGEVVGTVNGLNGGGPISYSQSLSETAICTGHM